VSTTVSLFLGYAFIWLVLGSFLFTLARRQSGLAHDIDRLERELERERTQS